MKFYAPTIRTAIFCCMTIIQWLFAKPAFSQCNGSLQPTVQIINPCAHDGQISVNVSNGTPPYTYEWVYYDDPTFTASTQAIQNLDPGYYGVTVRDANGNCGAKHEIFLKAPFYFNVTTTPEQCPNQDGSAEVTNIVGGAIPYSFLWNTGAITQKLTQISAGNYEVTVTDGNGCIAVYGDSGQRDSISIVVEQLNDIKLDITVTQAVCAINSASASVNVASGGTPPFTYVWMNTQSQQTWNTSSIQNVNGNAYYGVTVSDASGCFAQTFSYIQKTPSFAVTATSTQENCFTADGSATVVANGGNGPYTYQWSNGATSQTNGGIPSGFYTVTVTDNNNCQEISSAYVAPYSPVQIDFTLKHEICKGQNGELDITPSLGTPPYTYNWSHGPNTSKVVGLSAGSYSVSVTDSKGCQSFKYVYINDDPGFNVTVSTTEEKCQVAKGTAGIAVTGGTPPFTYVWSNGATTSQLSNLDAGYYTCTITDASGCSTVKGANITTNSQIYAYLSLAPEKCTAGDGSITVSVSGSHQPFSFVWNNGSTTQNISQLATGPYTITITDSKGCQLVKSQYLHRTSGDLKASILTTPATCLYNEDGKAEALVTGGTPPYDYQWGNGGQTNKIEGLKAYFGMGLIVTDASGCVDYQYVPTIGFDNTDCAGIIRGQVVMDDNKNCMVDGGDKGLENVMVSCIPSPQGLAFTNASGHYQYYVPKNTQHALTQQHGFLFPDCPASSIIVQPLNSGELSDQNNFYNDPAQVNDLVISMGYSVPPRPGFPFELVVQIDNKGLSKTDGQATIKYGSLVNYISGGTGHDAGLQEIYLSFTNLPAFNGSQKFVLKFETPPTVVLGNIQKYEAKVTPVLSDATKHNNEEVLLVTVVGSYDPNDKAVSLPNGLKSDCLTKNDTILKYTVRFQNTGNFPASFVIIKDTLHPNLDYTTLQGGASSHPYRMQFLPDGYLHFIFDPIFLPDSTRDEANSHGFVTYYISPKKTIAEDDWIYNTAAIYFDFNEPVITNTTSLITCRTSSSQDIENKNTLSVFPNPTSDLAHVTINTDSALIGQLDLYNMLGQRVNTWIINPSANQSNIEINTSHLPSGQYTLRYVDQNRVASEILIKQ